MSAADFSEDPHQTVKAALGIVGPSRSRSGSRRRSSSSSGGSSSSGSSSGSSSSSSR